MFEQLESIDSVTYDYRYPEGLNLKPGSEIHDDIVRMVMERADAASSFIKPRFAKWRELDRILTAYIDLDEEEKDIIWDDYRKPVSIVVPLSFANLETLLTYQVAAFLNDPIFRYEGVESRDTIGAILMQHVIDKQNRRFKNPLALHTMWRDGIVYGIGPVVVEWDRIMGYRKAEGNFFSRTAAKFFKSGPLREYVAMFEGNRIYNIDPYNYLPDPNTPLHLVQESEFQGWIVRRNRMSLLEDELGENSPWFNIKYLRHVRNLQSKYFVADGETGRYDSSLITSDSFRADDITNPVDVVCMFVNLIPSEWGLGDSDYPEKWFFAVAGDKYLIAASPQGTDHNMFPIAVDCPSFDGHGLAPTSPLEVTYGMHHAINWLWNNHVTNVRKSINDQLVIDPSIINYNDAATPKPGKLIRARRSAFGRNLRDAIFQLPVSDITRQNIADISVLKSLADEVSGATEAVKGLRRRTSERVSATEAMQVSNAALSRLEKYAKVSGWQSYFDLANIVAANTKELMSEEVSIKLTGDYAQELQSEYSDGFVNVSPSDIDVFYDIIPHDGSIPGNNDTQAWVQLYQIIANNPIIGQRFDLVRIFKHIARGMGAKNVDEFIAKANISSKVMMEEDIQKQVDKGNMIPVEKLSEVTNAPAY